MESRRVHDHWYLVDLTENEGQGRCGCQHWEYVCQVNQRTGDMPIHCIHVRAARDHLADYVIEEVLRQNGNTV